MIHDVAVVGGGPAGLAVATLAARAGMDVVLFDRQALPADKSCGEGVMPAGVKALERLGVVRLLSTSDASPFSGIRYVQEDGSSVEALLPDGGGLGVRRTALAGALLRRAREAGVEIRAPEGVRSHRRESDSIVLVTDRGERAARMLIAADGLHSPLRRAEGLDDARRGPRRYGLRQHFRIRPWTDRVEIHFSGAAEAYVTPCGEQRVGVAFLWEDEELQGDLSFDAVLARFPSLRARLDLAIPDSKPQGAGPFAQSARVLVTDRFALLGDAAGYVDALTGEGVSLALRSAEVLAGVLRSAIALRATRDSLLAYERFARGAFRRYARLTRAMVALARRPAMRRVALGAMARSPRMFERLVHSALT